VILVDANIPIYAEDSTSALHSAARRWWDAALSGPPDSVALCWPTLLAFIRLTTQPRIFKNPLTLAQACERVESWLRQPSVRLIEPTPAHWVTLGPLLTAAQASGNLVTDAHLAALAMEYGFELCSTDAGFARFPRLKWRNPLVSK
jgi:uncharacterized protein